ncbi:MAG: nucleotide sugar dehydrogenase [Actinomycetota bacterium]|nr:nucleotide sugar dehydrogenase [Actinomycetota bacterium]
MRISVFGLGYVGCVSAACLAARGHDVVGVDVDANKVQLVSTGRAPVVEEAIGELTADVVARGRLNATTDVDEAIRASELSLVCVGTPSAPNGSLATGYLERVAADIGATLVRHQRWHTVVFRSTMLPGTCEDLLIPILERSSGLRAGVDFGVAVNPEFLREGSSVSDFHDPPKTVVGEFDADSGDRVVALYEGLPGPVFRVPVRVAEMTKYVDNAFHGLKIGFANEIGALCAALGLDSHVVMEIFRSDRKLNISPAYLRPGFAFGGSCLPKDLRSLVHFARRSDVAVPILEHVLPSNDEHLRRAFDLVAATGRRRVGLFGLSFKPGTDDLRESPLVELCERLVGKGYDVRIYDGCVSLSRLVGANRAYIEDRLPHLRDLLCDTVAEVMDHAEVCLIGSTAPEVVAALDGAGGRTVIDLVRIPDAQRRREDREYIGLAW